MKRWRTSYAYDIGGRLKSGAEDWRYVYTADDERIWSFKTGGGSRWTLRDLGNNVLREYANSGGAWSVKEDFIHRGGQLLAAETSAGVSHFHLDHLGTPRLITNQSGVKTAYHVYWPYGEELTSATQNDERMKFTGHERDLNGAGGVGDDLDYMHARFCSPVTGRFLGVDPVGGQLGISISWNRYFYTRGNPLKFLDPDGADVEWFARDDAGGGLTNFGHSALRVVGDGYDRTYDFGRYGKTWGPFNSEGEGILRVWTDFNAFISSQSDKGSGLVVSYQTSEEFDQSVMSYFDSKQEAGSIVQSNQEYTSYRLDDDYELRSNNCTTICADALGSASRPKGKLKDRFVARDTRQTYSRSVDPRKIYDQMRMDAPQGMTIRYYSYQAPKK